jgi:hypothetical protein
MKNYKLLFLLTVLPALAACASFDTGEQREAVKPLAPDRTWDVRTKKTSAPPVNPIIPETPDRTWTVPIPDSGVPAAR